VESDMFWKTESNSLSFSIAQKIMLFYSITTMSIVVCTSLILFPSLDKLIHAYNESHHYYLFRECLFSLFIALLFSLFFTLLFARWIARQSIYQIDLLTNQINHITVDSLTQKINIHALPSELKQLGNAFNLMLVRINNSMEQLAQFSSDIAHELRNPIHNLLVMNEIALTKLNSAEKYHDVFESNLEECRYLLSLIENLWFIASSDHGQISIQTRYFNAKNEITKLIDYFESYANINEVTIHCEGDANINADIILFKRAMSNILSNSLKYTPKYGRITIKIEQSTADFIISISDTGIGIEEHHLSKIFNRFYRVDPSRSQQTGGLGLGLAIVKSIMSLHQGKIDIQSKLQNGTSVFLYFPI